MKDVRIHGPTAPARFKVFTDKKTAATGTKTIC